MRRAPEFEVYILHDTFSDGSKRYVAHDRVAREVASFDSYSHAADWIGRQHIGRLSGISNLKSEIHPA